MISKRYPGLADFARAFASSPIVTFMALSDIRARYKRSVLGPLWLTLGTAAGSVGLGFLWSELMHVDAKTFVPSLTAGLILWQLISGLITDSSTLFSRQASIIRNLGLPLSIHPLQLLIRHLVNLAHNAPVFFVIALILDLPFNLNTWLAIPALLITALNLLWISMVVSLIGARFRDFEYMVSMVMPLLMFISPVFYRPNYLPFSENLIWSNPLSHLIELVRYPLLGQAPPPFVIATSLGMACAGMAFALWLFNRKHDRIAFWI